MTLTLTESLFAALLVPQFLVGVWLIWQWRADGSDGIKWKPLLKRVGKVLGSGVGGTALITLYAEVPEAREWMHYVLTLLGGGGVLAAFQKFKPKPKDWAELTAEAKQAMHEKFDATVDYHECRVCHKTILVKSQECGHDDIGYRHLDCHDDKPIHAPAEETNDE